MTDRWVVTLALATAFGAWASKPIPFWAAVAIAVVALAVRAPLLLCAGSALLASALGASAWRGLDLDRVPRGRVDGVVTLVGDPVTSFGAQRVDVRLADGMRVQAIARGAQAGAVRSRLAGERLELRGSLRPLTGPSRPSLQRRHIRARLSVERVGRWWPGSPLARVANELRRTLVEGAVSLGDARQALYAGLVLGDDRAQGEQQVADFRDAGLTHLLAVSGQNVAFVLAVASPLLMRLQLRGRFVVGVAVLGVFGVVTRWEPSVLRAIAMASVAMFAAAWGQQASAVRVLAVASTALLLIDPLLVGSIGFLLSVGACAGIAFLGPTLSHRLPAPIAVTLAAQAGVAPMLVSVFSGVPVASLPANLLAVPAAGPAMVWGMAAGLPAGIVGGTFAAIIHWPTRVLLAWIAGVAAAGASLPLGNLTAPHMVAVAAITLVAFVLRRRARVVVACVTLAVATCAHPALVLALQSRRTFHGAEVATGVRLWRSGGTVVVVAQSALPRDLRESLARRGIRRVDLLITRSSTAPIAARLVVTPSTAPRGSVIRAGPYVVSVRSMTPRLEVRVSKGAASAGSP